MSRIQLANGIVVATTNGRFVSSTHAHGETVAALLREAERLEARSRQLRALAGQSAQQDLVRSEK